MFDGGGGQDQAQLNDLAAPAAAGFTYSSLFDSIDRNGPFARLRYSTTESVHLTASHGDNVFYVPSLSAGVNLYMFGSGGNDVVFPCGNGQAPTLDVLRGNVFFNGDDGLDTVIVNDWGTTSDYEYTIGFSSVRRIDGMTGSISYVTDALVLNTSSGRNGVHVLLANAATAITVNGGEGNDTLSAGGGDIDEVRAAITFNGGAGSDLAVLHDEPSNESRSYQLNPGTIDAAAGSPLFGSLHYDATVEDVVIYGSAAAENSWNIAGTLAGTTTTIYASAADDTFAVGDDNLDTLAGALVISAGEGYDQLTVNDYAATADDAYIIDAATITRDRFGGLTFGGAEMIRLNGGSGDNDIAVRGANPNTPFLILAGWGDDVIRVTGNGSILDFVPGWLTVAGGIGADALVVDDSASGYASHWTVTPEYVTRDRDGLDVDTTVAYDGVETVTTLGGHAVDTFVVHGTIAGTPVHLATGSSNQDSIYVYETDPTAPVAVMSGGNTGANVIVNADGVGSAHVVFGGMQRVHALSILSGGVATLADAGGGLLHVTGGVLNITGTGKLDLGHNDLALDYTGASPIGSADGSNYTGILGLVQAGYNYGAWTGSGITTSAPGAAGGVTTLAVAEASDVFGIAGGQTAAFGGAVVDATTILIKYTYAGDANLDGEIDPGDFGIIDYFAQIPGSIGYACGDFNFDGFIDAADYGVIDYSIQHQGSPL